MVRCEDGSMAGVFTIAKKEFVDHVTDHTFLLSFGALLIVMVGSTLFQVQWFQDYQSSHPDVGEMWKTSYWSSMLINNIAGQISTLGAFFAISLSFASINEEQTEGSLKVLLSYPIHRDKVILGKLVAGFTLISLVTAASITISLGIQVFYLSIPLTIDFLFRVVTVTIMGIVLLSFFLCLGTAVSSMVHDSSASLMILLASIVLLRSDMMVMILILAGSLLPLIGINFMIPAFLKYVVGPYSYSGGATISPVELRDYIRFSPIESFRALSEILFTFEKRSGYPLVIIPLSYWKQLNGSLDLIVILVLFLFASLVASYVLFTRREIT